MIGTMILMIGDCQGGEDDCKVRWWVFCCLYIDRCQDIVVVVLVDKSKPS